MSDPPDLDENEAFAAEHALGVLTSAERRRAEVRMASDPDFAALVEAWRGRLAPLSETAISTPAPRSLWPRIARALPANDDAKSAGALRFWRRATAASLTLAAASLAVTVLLVNRPASQSPSPSGQLLNASLVSRAGAPTPLFVAAYDPARKALIVTSLIRPGADPAHVHELWVIPADGKPRPLGFIAPGRTQAMPMPLGVLPSMVEGAAIAVSVEPPGGSPQPSAPSGPIAAAGKLARI